MHHKGDHFVRSCPTASKDEMDKLLAQLRETSKKPKPAGETKAKAEHVNCSGAGRADPSASVCLNGKLKTPTAPTAALTETLFQCSTSRSCSDKT